MTAADVRGPPGTEPQGPRGPVPALRLLAALLLLAAGCAREELLHDLDERQAGEAIVVLDQGGIPARKARAAGPEGGYTVEVPPGDADRALRLLADRDLPRPRPPGFGEVFSRGGIVPTATEERALYQHALAGELARTVEAIDGVVGARVHVALPERDPLRPADRPSPRAAVLVRCRPAACAALRAMEPGIRALVAGAAEGLEAGAVAVVVAEAPEAPAPAPPARPRRAVAPLALSAAAGLGALAALGGWLHGQLARRRVRSTGAAPSGPGAG
jgi:type III secretion protein J